jgi:hypothetical protein
MFTLYVALLSVTLMSSPMDLYGTQKVQASIMVEFVLLEMVTTNSSMNRISDHGCNQYDQVRIWMNLHLIITFECILV